MACFPCEPEIDPRCLLCEGIYNIVVSNLLPRILRPSEQLEHFPSLYHYNIHRNSLQAQVCQISLGACESVRIVKPRPSKCLDVRWCTSAWRRPQSQKTSFPMEKIYIPISYLYYFSSHGKGHTNVGTNVKSLIRGFGAPSPVLRPGALRSRRKPFR